MALPIPAPTRSRLTNRSARCAIPARRSTAPKPMSSPASSHTAKRGRGELMVKVVGSLRPAGEVAIAIGDRPDGLEVCLNGCADDQHANCPTSDPAGNILSVLEGQGQLAGTKPLPALRPRLGC